MIEGAPRRGLTAIQAWSLGLVVLVIAAVVVALIWWREDPTTGGVDPSGSGPPSPSPSASTSPTSSPDATPSASATAVAPSGSPPAAGTWQLTDTFGSGVEQPTFVFDATAWYAGFIAIGVRFDSFASDSGPYGGRPMLYVSEDGLTWEETGVVFPTGEVSPDGRIEHIVTLPDGRLLAVSEHGSLRAWVSADSQSWTPIDLGLGGASVSSLVAGERGLVLIARSTEGADQAWFSTDGIEWELTHSMTVEEDAQLEQVAAGPEGFVIVGALRGDGDRPHVLASSDGRTWFLAPDQPAFDGPSQFPFDVAPLGTDWVATGFGATEEEQRSAIWRSADGLTWTRDLGPADPQGGNSYYATDIAGAAGHVILSPAEFCLCGPFQDPTVAWSTTDGVTWTQVDPDGSYVTEVVASGSTVIAVGRIGRGESAAFWRLVAAP